MLHRFGSALIIAVGIVAAAFLVRTSPSAQAGGAACDQPKIVSFFVEHLERGETRVIGSVPENKFVLLKDFLGIINPGDGGGVFELLADGQPIIPGLLPLLDPVRNPLCLSAGLSVPGGKELSIRSAGGGDQFATFLILGELRQQQ